MSCLAGYRKRMAEAFISGYVVDSSDNDPAVRANQPLGFEEFLGASTKTRTRTRYFFYLSGGLDVGCG